MRPEQPIKVLIVDDSPLVRAMLSRALAAMPDIEIAGGAKDPFEARELIINMRPHVIILDIEMPRMDGLTFLAKLMAHYPVPVIMCSGVAPSSSAAALKAIELGAVDVVSKPADGGSDALRRLGAELADKVRAAAASKLARPRSTPAPSAVGQTSFRAAGLDPNRYVIAIGASTGGTEAIREVLARFPADCPPTVMVQHMPAGFTRSFAERLDQLSTISVREAADGAVLTVGEALLAPGGVQLGVRASGGMWRAVHGGGEPVNRHCPSVDYLFDSLTRCPGRQIIGVILTGMGADGAAGLLALKQQGALTIGQDERSCVVYGMPKAAADAGAIQAQTSPENVATKIVQLLKSSAERRCTPARAGT